MCLFLHVAYEHVLTKHSVEEQRKVAHSVDMSVKVWHSVLSVMMSLSCILSGKWYETLKYVIFFVIRLKAFNVSHGCTAFLCEAQCYLQYGIKKIIHISADKNVAQNKTAHYFHSSMIGLNSWSNFPSWFHSPMMGLVCHPLSFRYDQLDQLNQSSRWLCAHYGTGISPLLSVKIHAESRWWDSGVRSNCTTSAL